MFMQKYTSQTYALMRIMVGFIFLWHGTQKLFGFPSPMPMEPPAFVIYIAGPIELFGGLFVMLGLYTHWAAFITSGLMAFAYWMGHGTKAFLPSENGGELAAIYCFVYLYIAAVGSGIWSLDAKRRQQG